MSSRDEWAGLLDEGEEILWQGRPEHRLRLEFKSPLEAVIAIVFVGFSIFWMNGAAQSGGYFWTFGLLFFAVGLYQLVGQHIWAAMERRRTFYTLTNRRAIIAKTSVTGTRRLKSYPIGPGTRVTLEEAHGLGSVHFATQTRTNSKGHETTRDIGFELLPDAREVLGMMRGLQQHEEVGK